VPPTSGASGSTIYAGGAFTTIGGQSRNYIAALDASTGLATEWNPSANSIVWALAVASPTSGVDGSTVYVGGEFTGIGGQARNHVAALDAGNGLATEWNPSANSVVLALAVAPPTSGVSDRTIYAGGKFTGIGGQSRNCIAALDASSGLATAWNPNANSAVYVLAAAPPLSGTSGSMVYAGGPFTSISGQTRNNIAALDTRTGRATDWDPNVNKDGRVLTLAISPPTFGGSGSTIYVGGDFTSIGGQFRNNIAALDASTGLATAWNPNVDSQVYALAVAPPISGVAPGSTIYAGGRFTSVGGQPHSNLVALDAGTGAPTTWTPLADGIVDALTVSGNTIYAGGTFTHIGGQPRYHVAALDASNGLATTWNPSANSIVLTLAVAPPISEGSNSVIYAGGNFSTIGGQPRNYIAALDASTGLATNWNPNANSSVDTLTVSGSTVYAGGRFTSIGGQPRNYVAAQSADTGLTTSWNLYANSNVWALAAASPTSGVSGSTIYVGGSFTSISGRFNPSIAALRDGALTCQSAGSGGSWRAANWSNCGGAIPGDGDSIEVGHAITLYNSLAANDLTIHPGGELNLPQGSNLTLEGSLTNNGRLTQTLAVPSATTFLNIRNAAGSANKYFGLTLTPGGDMGNTTVTIRGNQNCTSDPNDVLVKRCFEISPTTQRSATARFYYSYAELNGQTYDQLKLWRQNFHWPQGGLYNYSPTCNAGQQDCWLEAYNLSVRSSFVLGSQFGSQVYPLMFLPWLGR
jgi:hypothetical protein